MWGGRRSHVLGRMLRHAAFRPDLVSVQSLAFVLWATASPRSLRLLLQLLGKSRNRRARRRLAGLEVIEWGDGPSLSESVADRAPEPARAGR